MGPMLFGAISMGPQQFGADSKGLHVFEAMSSEAKTKKAQYYRGPDEQGGPISSEPNWPYLCAKKSSFKKDCASFFRLF